MKRYIYFNLLFSGLEDSISPYAHYFINNNVTGQGLLHMTTEDLIKLHVEKIGHQVYSLNLYAAVGHADWFNFLKLSHFNL